MISRIWVAFLGASIIIISRAFLTDGFTTRLPRYDPTQRKSSPFRQSKFFYSENEAVNTAERPPCFYRAPSNNWWVPRQELTEVKVGDELTATIVQELLDGQTGPKVFCEVGVGRCRHEKWSIVNAMLRLGKRGTRKSAVQKRVKRLRDKHQGFSVFVSKIRLDNNALEVVLNEEELQKTLEQPKPIALSSLKAGQEVTGQVVRVEPYGVFVDVGATRPGLLHIRRVSHLMQKFIAQKEGLEEVGLGKGSRVMLQVESIERKRLSLDFTESVKKEAFESKNQSKQKHRSEKSPSSSKEDKLSEESADSVKAVATVSSTNNQLSADEEAAWAAYASMQSIEEDTTTQESSETTNTEDNEEQEEDDNDDYDEDREIEDALGLGFY